MWPQEVKSFGGKFRWGCKLWTVRWIYNIFPVQPWIEWSGKADKIYNLILVWFFIYVIFIRREPRAGAKHSIWKSRSFNSFSVGESFARSKQQPDRKTVGKLTHRWYEQQQKSPHILFTHKTFQLFKHASSNCYFRFFFFLFVNHVTHQLLRPPNTQLVC